MQADATSCCASASKCSSTRGDVAAASKRIEKGEHAVVRRVRRAAGTSQLDKTIIDNENDDDEDGCFRERALEEKCGVFGVISNGDWPTSLDVAHIICLGLVGLQHRGQESAGIVTCKRKGEPFNVSRSEGLVSSAFNEMSMMSLKGNLGLGHTRYSTSGGSGCIQLAQPFVVHTKYGTIAVAHNGELVNSSHLRETLLSHGVGLTTGGDSELITQCLSQTPPDRFVHPKLRKRASRLQQQQQQNNNISQQQNADDSQNNKDADNHSAASELAAEAAKGVRGGGGGGGDDDGRKRSTASAGERAPIWRTDLNTDENNICARLLYLMSLTPVSYSLIVMYNECLYATRDSFGNRPLSIGMLVPSPNESDFGSIPYSVIDNAYVEGWCISSESCPFPSVHAKLKRDVEPGEIVKFERNKMPKTLAFMPRPGGAVSPAFCIFEYVYFARPDSILERQMVYAVRMKCGERLADESPAVRLADNPDAVNQFIVAPVPESSIPAALGYHQRSGIPYVEVFCKNRYVGRTFIQPSTRLRRLGVAKKFGPLTENFAGKSIILIDDSIVRGTTIGHLVRLLREAGAKEVHIRIASPPLHYPCYMGINIPTKEELIANHLSPDKLALTLGAASLRYLSVEGLRESVQSGIRQQLQVERTRLKSVGCASEALADSAAKWARNSGHPDHTLVSTPIQAQQQQQQSECAQQEVASSAADANELAQRVGHCDACLTGKYPVELDEDEMF